MRDDLEDALVPVKWAEAQIPIMQGRLQAWHHSYPYNVVAESDPDSTDRELIVAYLEEPLDPLIVGDVGAMISSIRTSLNLLMSAVVARNGIKPERAPDFPTGQKPDDFLGAIKGLENKSWISTTEASAIKKTRAYDPVYPGGDVVLFHIAKLDNLRKHQRLLRVDPVPTLANITAWGPGIDKVMLHMKPMQDKTILYRIPKGIFRPSKGNAHVAAEVFLNEAAAGIGDKPALVALRVFIGRVDALIRGFP